LLILHYSFDLPQTTQQFPLQGLPSLFHLSLNLSILRQQLVGGVAFQLADMGVLDVEVIAGSLDIVPG
jgi:hypothetical protein